MRIVLHALALAIGGFKTVRLLLPSLVFAQTSVPFFALSRCLLQGGAASLSLEGLASCVRLSQGAACAACR